MNFLTWTCPSAVKHWIFLQVTFSWGALIIKWHTTVISCDSQTCNTCVRHILRKGAIKIYPTCTDNTEVINVAKLMALYQSRLRSHCSATKKKMYSNTEHGAHLCRLCLQKRCMLALLLDSLSGCPLSSRCQFGGCLWLRSTFYCLRSAHWWRIPPGPFLLTRRFLQAGGGTQNQQVS